ncbi:MAG: methionine adenosyltransferase [Candidatus Shapirobacteria bacterium]|jgi:S-adenosylmethionine synthetase
MNYSLFASEAVCAGHPDKVCDQISDGVVDTALANYPKSRVACETLVTVDKVIMAGEVTCPDKIDFEQVARNTIKQLGYTIPELSFTDKSAVEVYVHCQSPDIAMGVDDGGAGDQGMMYGYAVSETPNFMPLPIVLAQELCQAMDDLQQRELSCLLPDGKSEVAVRYENGKPVAIEKIVLAKPFDRKVNKEEVKQSLYKLAVLPLLEKYKLPPVALEEVVLNGTGQWEIGGPASDTGVTGRKIVVDTYGGMGRIGGGAFSGKDPTKVDRSGAYAARYIAKNIVAAGLADRCEVQLAFVIGHKQPIAKAIETFGTNKYPTKAVEDYAWGLMDLSVGGIIQELDLLRPIYQKTAAYGHFGKDGFPWEKIKTDK